MTTLRRVISGPNVPKPLGPYSPGVRAGDTLYVAGQVGLDPATGEAAGETIAAQAKQAFRNVEAVLRAGGSRLELVVNVTLLVAEMSAFADVNEIFAETFPADPPARMTIQTPLPLGMLISVGCVALADSP